MKSKIVLIAIFMLVLTSVSFPQMTVKDTDPTPNILMRVNDEGTVGSITLPLGLAAPSSITYKLYNLNGSLFWDGLDLTTAGSSMWSLNGASAYYNDGNVGIGIASPASKLHIKDTNSEAGPAMRINGAVGVYGDISYPDEGKHVGDIIFQNYNLPVAGISVERGFWWNYGSIVFYTDKGGPSYGERMRITKDGNVGIGTSSPGSFKLAVNGSAAKPGGGHWSTFSDMRLKDVNSTYDYGLSELCKLSPFRYNYSENNDLGLPSGNEYVGVSAQEVREAIPDAVEVNDKGYLMVNNDPIIWAMLNAIKELKAENKALRDELEQRMKTLEARVER